MNGRLLTANASILRYIIGFCTGHWRDTQTQAKPELTLLGYDKYNNHILSWVAKGYGQDINIVLLSVLLETHPGPLMVAIRPARPSGYVITEWDINGAYSCRTTSNSLTHTTLTLCSVVAMEREKKENVRVFSFFCLFVKRR